MTGAPAIGAVVAFWGFWALLAFGWAIGELDLRRTVVFVVLWVTGRIGAGYVFYGVLFTPLVAVLDIALVFTIFKGDVRLR